ncbi:type II toxin-antitoxin system PemK/MazF family toxin [Paenibacillus koleovorans]|uniref:type II toxin-antitoxin system PemK/MazF family toxin n=1 Tax=Paenibacillus koleovorans TaxID=121608 RepID=UPI000FD9C405|nr:type II toxin-antitoxin system PemK/MazF family toxin [Paenibacillus koleovorans]
MMLRESDEEKQKVRLLLEAIYSDLETESAEDALKYAGQLVELTKMRIKAKSGWLPDVPFGAPGKFRIIRQCVYNVNFSPVVGSEQDLTRPAVIVRTSGGNTVMVIPLTDEQYGNKLYFNVDLERPFDPRVNSTALVEQTQVVDKRRIVSPYRIKGQTARVDDTDMLRILSALAQLTSMNLDEIAEYRIRVVATQGIKTAMDQAASTDKTMGS